MRWWTNNAWNIEQWDKVNIIDNKKQSNDWGKAT